MQAACGPHYVYTHQHCCTFNRKYQHLHLIVVNITHKPHPFKNVVKLSIIKGRYSRIISTGKFNKHYSFKMLTKQFIPQKWVIQDGCLHESSTSVFYSPGLYHIHTHVASLDTPLSNLWSWAEIPNSETSKSRPKNATTTLNYYLHSSYDKHMFSHVELRRGAHAAGGVGKCR